MTELVAVRRDEHVLVVTLQRESKRNAVDRHLANAIDGCWTTMTRFWAGVLTGSPTFFSAGSDLTAQGDYVT